MEVSSQNLNSFFPFITTNVARGKFNFDVFKKVCNIHSKLMSNVLNKHHMMSNMAKNGTVEMMEPEIALADKVLDAYVELVLEKYNEMQSHAQALKNFDHYNKEITATDLKRMIKHEPYNIPPELLTIMKEVTKDNRDLPE